MVTKWLKNHGLSFQHSSGNINCLPSLYQTGCNFKLNDQFILSIQTDPSIAGEAFAETAIISTETEQLDYRHFGSGDVKRFKTPENLFNEIEWLLEEAQKTAIERKMKRAPSSK